MILFLINIKFSYQESNDLKILEVYDVINSQLLIKYKGTPLYINFTELSNGKTRIQINEIDDEEGMIGNEQYELNNFRYKENNNTKNNGSFISQPTNSQKNNDYPKFILFGLIVFVIIIIITIILCWFYYKKHKEVSRKTKTLKTKQSNVDKDTKSSTTNSIAEKKHTIDKSSSNSTALTFPISKSDTSFSSSTTYHVPKLESIVISEKNDTNDTSTLVSMKSLSNRKNLSIKSLSTFINALAFFALETTEQETTNKTLKSSNLQSTQLPSEMLTEQYLISSLPNSKVQIKPSSSQSKTPYTRIIKTDNTQDSEEEKNSKSDPPEDSTSSSFKSSNIGSISSIHHSDISTQISK
ncbi:Hypothetical protein SRAE_2000034200 [Strongyloides ratti]|uniref:Uncharacterized protein n=1 Tax=Strongyloides ratti TaxID=34506 RepID=A0A090LDU5_STRRB|nr:Hypothetical protein SRAE_2000034200 [Strongyloides ratti]CEF65665.1 Hypothetical protein SRAE_2000034200 [Strongyloides ratti]